VCRTGLRSRMKKITLRVCWFGGHVTRSIETAQRARTRLSCTQLDGASKWEKRSECGLWIRLAAARRTSHGVASAEQSDGDDGRRPVLAAFHSTGRSYSLAAACRPMGTPRAAEHPRQMSCHRRQAAMVTVIHAVAPRRPDPESTSKLRSPRER
jgi:hypothetical protein